MNRVQWLLTIFFTYSLICRNGGEDTAGDELSAPNNTIEGDSSEIFIKDHASAEHEQYVINRLEPSVEESLKHQNEETFTQQVFSEATSLNSGAANQITNDPQVFVTLTDVATEELQNRALLPPEDTPPNPPSNTTDEQIHNKTEAPPQDKKDNLTEEIPSFSEWTQKQIEAEKVMKETTNNTTQPPQNPSNGNKKATIRWKNYASVDCGAKVVASNPEAVSPSAVLSPSRDEYKLNTCTSRIWFVVELCEAIQAKKIDFANFELFSSSPKDFSVYVSDRFPTRDWSNVGQFMAKDERDIQSFDLHPHLFGKYIKVEVKSHYGSEHYCPISLFRVYGTSEFEVLQKEDQGNADDDDEVNDENLDLESGGNPKNLFSSATDAVMSIVKKAASVLGQQKNQSNQTIDALKTNHTQIELCTSPSHIVICNNCTEALYAQTYHLISCYMKHIETLVTSPLIKTALSHSNICKQFGFELEKHAIESILSDYIKALFKTSYLAAMCNTEAVLANKLALNVTMPFVNATAPKTDDIVKIEMSEKEIGGESDIVTDTLVVTTVDVITKTTSITDSSVTSQISPTKTITADLGIDQNLTNSVDPVVDYKNDTDKSNHTGEAVQVESTDNNTEHEENATETIEDLEGLINDLNGDVQAVSKTTTVTPQVQKESVFLRLSNRIKALERNMSLSGQYLEELSKRYKKQVEEMQKLLDKTVLSMTEQNKRIEEHNKVLEDKLETLTANLEALLSDTKSWSSTIFCILISSLTTFFIVTFCHRSSEQFVEPAEVKKHLEITRRRSLDETATLVKPKKKRRPSDQALKIVRSSLEHVEQQNRKKKKRKMKRSASINTLDEDCEYHTFKPQTMSSQVWNRQESAPPKLAPDWVEGKHLEEVPFVLEESEHSILEPLDERITPPKFVKTALNARESRSNSGSPRKSHIVDETSRTTAVVNGNVNTDPAKKGKPGGLKRILKKVF